MLIHSNRRWLPGLAVAGALVAVSATPAAAMNVAAGLGVYLPDTTIAVDTEGKVESPILYASKPVVLQRPAVRFDYRGLAGKVKVTPESGTGECGTPEPNVLACRYPFEMGIDEHGIAGMFNVVIAPTSEAKDGDSGELKVTFSADGAAPVSHTSTVRFGEGVDLAGGPESTFSAKPGGTFSAPLVLANVGETSAKGAAVFFDLDYAIRPTKHYSNCTYRDDRLISCRFTETVAPGEVFSASVPYTLGRDTYAPGNEYGYHMWMTPNEFDDYLAYLESRDFPIGEPGTDEALVLTKKPALNANSFQADTDPTNNWSGMQIKVTGTNGTDLAAIGTTLGGRAGEVVTATVGVRNNGPASLDFGRSGSPVTKIDIVVPTGTTAVEVPEACHPLSAEGEDWGNPGKPGAREYRCYPDVFIATGETQTVKLGLRIDKVVPNATGTVIINAKCECEGFVADTNPANDTAKIVVNAAGGTGGSLPITGTSTGLVAGLGGLLLAVGLGGFMLAKRRRTRFVV